MLLAVDIGNSSIKFGLFDGDRLVSKFSIPTTRYLASHTVEEAVANRLVDVEQAMIVSVVPQAEPAMRKFLRSKLGIDPVVVDSSFDFGFEIDYQPVTAVGADRLVAAFAGVQRYGTPLVVCDLGTATTIDAVSSGRRYLGGVIAPGVETMAEALHLRASKLPLVEIAKPASVIGNSTVTAIRSGVFYGYIGLLEGLINRMIVELGEKPTIVATGGWAKTMARSCEMIDVVDENLVFGGLLSLSGR